MATVTLGEAAKLTGLGKTTIARAIKAGRVSAGRTDTGYYEIDPAELDRVFPIKPPVAVTVPVVQDSTPALEAQINGLREVGELLRQQLIDVREDRDRWRQQAERLVLPAPSPPVSSDSRPPWWRRLVG